MTRDREVDRATLRTVLEAAQRGELARAAELAQLALADGLEHPLLFNVAALDLESQERVTEAEALLWRAVRMAPQDIPSRNALGLCLLRLERASDALEQFDRILEQDAQLSYVHASRGNALRALGATAAAQASYERALTLDANQGVALAGLASIATKRGAYGDARRWAGRALELIPDFPDAAMSLATAELGEGQPRRAEARVRALLADTRLSALEHAYAHGMLGDVLDATERPAEAFAAYTSCNEELGRLYGGRYESALDYVRAMLGYFARTPSELWKAPPAARAAAASGHVFLMGFPRSGTTLLEVILEGHPGVVSLEEHELLIDAVGEFMQEPAELGRLVRATAIALDPLRAAYWRRVADGGVDVTGKLFVDKYPLNILKLPLIARLFPGAKILFACRDPRDVVLSCFRHRFHMSAPIYELLTIEGAARYYDSVMQLAIRLTSTLPLAICLVRHEDVVREFQREMKRICEFVGIDWHPAMGDFALRTQERTTFTPSTAQLVRGLNTEGLGQWRRYGAQLAPVCEVLEPWLQRFYYDS
jgi:tetratricopeptide (TPR) repeat protein